MVAPSKKELEELTLEEMDNSKSSKKRNLSKSLSIVVENEKPAEKIQEPPKNLNPDIQQEHSDPPFDENAEKDIEHYKERVNNGEMTKEEFIEEVTRLRKEESE